MAGLPESPKLHSSLSTIVTRRLGIPEQVIVDRVEKCALLAPFLLCEDRHDVALAAEDLVEHRPDQVEILIAHLDENRSAIRQELPNYSEPVAQVGKIGMNP